MTNQFAIATVRCAGPNCTAVRQEANHWFVVSASGDVFGCEPYYPGYKLGEKDQPVCGQACAQKLFEKYLSK